MISVSTRLLIVWVLFVVTGTLAPFDFGATAAVHEHSFKMFQYGSYERDPMDFVLNLLLFMPLGALLHHEGQRRSLKLRSIVILTVATGFLISMTVEYFQRFLPTRDSSLIDVLANVAGGLVGVFGDKAWGASLAVFMGRLRARTSPAALASVMAGVMVLGLLTSGALQARTRLSTWSAEYPLLVGNEQTGDRPWRGRVFALTITDAPTPLALARRFSAGESVVLHGSRIAAVDFSGNSPYRDATGNLPDLDWTERANESSNAGITLTGRPWLRTDGPASRLAHRLRETNAFTVRIDCATDDTNQHGPARIVSNSASTSLRNFTIGQLGADLSVRFRTPQTGNNGSGIEMIAAGVFSGDHRRDILVTYDGATLLTAVAHTSQIGRTELTPAAVVALRIASLTSQRVYPDQVQMYNTAYLAALFLPPGALLGLLGRTRRDRLVFGAVYLLAAAVLLEGTLVLASGRAIDFGNVTDTAGVGAVVLALVSVIFSQPDRRRNPGRARWVAAAACTSPSGQAR
jgi:VanZ family protein